VLRLGLQCGHAVSELMNNTDIYYPRSHYRLHALPLAHFEDLSHRAIAP